MLVIRSIETGWNANKEKQANGKPKEKISIKGLKI
jgi:hypothetical protein